MNKITANEAAVVLGLEPKAVHRAIDSGLLDRNGPGRLLSPRDLIALKADTSLSSLVPLETRKRIVRKLRRASTVAWVYEGDFLAIDVRRLRATVTRSMAQLRALQKLAVSDPEIMGGEPVFRGTRIPVSLIAVLIERGDGMRDILEGYPALSERQVRMAPLWVKTYPRRGRPPKQPWHGLKPARRVRIPRKAR
jgi:uncharacterized protein (DUF433 family)